MVDSTILDRDTSSRPRRIPKYEFVVFDVYPFEMVEKAVRLLNQEHRIVVFLKRKQGKSNIHIRILDEALYINCRNQALAQTCGAP